MSSTSVKADGQTLDSRPLDAEAIAQQFGVFSRIAHADADYHPYGWQIRLAQHVVSTGIWPERIVAPTGSGKTSVVDVHLFAQALAGLGQGAPSPRRLALIVNRRALVDSQYDDARREVEHIVTAAESGDAEAARFVSGWKRRGLAADSTEGATDTVLDVDIARSGVQVVNLRGGQAVKDPNLTAWRKYPDAVSVLNFTPEMFGSRLLFRGYGLGRGARPIEAGLLAYDTVAIVDEAHLSQQLVLTARQVRRIERGAESPLPVLPLQVVISTATPQQAETTDAAAAESVGAGARVDASGGTMSADSERRPTEIQVAVQDLEQSERLRDRLQRPKPLKLIDIPTGLRERAGLDRFAQEAIALRARTGGTVGVVVNTVAAALQVASLLKAEEPSGSVVTLVGRLRPYDRSRIQDEHAGLFSPKGDAAVAFVVGTQTLEVGLDIGFAGLVTELAPGDALAQRAGRVNRFARYQTGPIVVAVPPKEYRDRTGKEGRRASSIYSSDDLNRALEWLRGIEQTAPEIGLTPWQVKENVPPRTTGRRAVLQRLEWWDVETLSASGEQLASEQRIAEAGPATLDVWLRDDLDDVQTVGVAVRGDLPENDGLSTRLLELIPPLAEEIAQVPIGQIYAFKKRFLESDENEPERVDDEATASSRRPRAFIVHFDREVDAEPLTETSTFSPGDVFVLSDTTPAFDAGVFSPKGKKPLADVLDGVLASRAAAERRVWALGDGAKSGGEAAFAGARSIPSQWAVRLTIPRVSDGSDTLPLPQGVSDLTRDEVWALADRLRVLQQDGSDDERDDDAGSLQGPAEEEGTAAAALLEWLATHPAPPREAGDGSPASSTEAAGLTGSSFSELRWLAGGNAAHREALVHIVSGRRATVEYLGTDDEDDEYTIVFATYGATSDDEFTQVSTPGRHAVLLADHEHDVGARAAVIAERSGLGGLADLLRQAGLLHDEGKADPRFQRLLGRGRLPKDLWAKSVIRQRGWEQRFRHEHHLVGWRHEQRSAAVAWLKLAEHRDADRELITRLVGTTHGHGLTAFPHGSGTLLPADEAVSEQLREAARQLFDEGEWESIVERTGRRHGLWGVAYLEAVLRAADVQISEEGK